MEALGWPIALKVTLLRMRDLRGGHLGTQPDLAQLFPRVCPRVLRFLFSAKQNKDRLVASTSPASMLCAPGECAALVKPSLNLLAP